MFQATKQRKLLHQKRHHRLDESNELRWQVFLLIKSVMWTARRASAHDIISSISSAYPLQNHHQILCCLATNSYYSFHYL
mmetsp:Transcript_29612/g.60610  ORF Transcript_29612/g.60610 Transcript_29612/m.60610 type:complete len:80 (-) Transcript_29612:70-309(-)